MSIYCIYIYSRLATRYRITYKRHPVADKHVEPVPANQFRTEVVAPRYVCWNFLQSAFFGSRILLVYEPLFDDDAKSALGSLKKYFGKKNLIEAVRNRHTFHYAPDQISRGFSKLAEEEPLNAYVAAANANTLYAFADVAAGYSVVEDICPGDPAKAYDALISETSKVLGWFNQVIAACMVVAIQKHIGNDLEALGATEVVQGAPDWKAVTIPYFVEMADSEVT